MYSNSILKESYDQKYIEKKMCVSTTAVHGSRGIVEPFSVLP